MASANDILILDQVNETYSNIKAGKRHCYNYIDTVQDFEQDDCTEIYDRIDRYDNQIEQLKINSKLCTCDKFSLKTMPACYYCGKPFSVD